MTHSLDQIKALARDFFERYPDAEACAATSDGNIFHIEKLALARVHARDAGCTLYAPITRSEAYPDPQPAPQAAEEDDSAPEDAAKKPAKSKRPARRPVRATPEDRSPDDDE